MNKDPIDSFEEFAELMMELVNSFNKVMQSEDKQAKLSAIELFGEMKSTMGDSLMHLMEKYDIYPADIEKFLKKDQSDVTKRVLEVHEQFERVNQQITPEIEKTLGLTGKE